MSDMRLFVPFIMSLALGLCPVGAAQASERTDAHARVSELKTARGATGRAAWSKTFGGVSHDNFSSVQQTADGGYILAGHEASWGNGLYDGWVMKLDASGNTLWANTFGGQDDEMLTSVRQTTDGGYIVAGLVGSWGSGSADGWVIKLDSNGSKTWAGTFGGTSEDVFSSVRQTSDGGYVVAGWEASWGSGSTDGWVVKLDSNGNKVWSNTFGGTSMDRFYSVRQTGDGGYIVAGYEASWGSGGAEGWVMKLDSNGNKVWSNTFGGSLSDVFWSGQLTADGGVIVAGEESSWGSGDADAWIMKLDSSGNKVWSNTFGGTDADSFDSVQQTTDGGYIVAGDEASWGLGGSDAWLMKLDANGTRSWSNTFGGSSDDYFDWVEEHTDGGYLVAGSEASWGLGGYDAWLMKLDSSRNK